MFFQSEYNWFPTIPDGIVTNLPLFPSGFWLILHWGRLDSQALNLTLGILKLWTGIFELSSFRSQLISNISRCHNSESTPIPIRDPAMNQLLFSSGFLLILHWRGMDSLGIDSHCQWIEVVEGHMPGASNQVPTVVQQFQMAQEWIYPNSHLGSHWFQIGGEQTPEPLNLILGILELWKGVFQEFLFRSKLVSNNCQWHINKSTPIPFLISMESALGENWISSCWFKFSVDWRCGQGYSRCL